MNAEGRLINNEGFSSATVPARKSEVRYSFSREFIFEIDVVRILSELNNLTIFLLNATIR